jgi:hypothetical protein
MITGDFGLTKKMRTTTADEVKGPTKTIGAPFHLASELSFEDSVPYPVGINVEAETIVRNLEAKKIARNEQQLMIRIRSGI